MSTPSHSSSTATSSYDMRQADETWKNFNRLTKWIAITCIVVLACMALFLTGHHSFVKP